MNAILEGRAEARPGQRRICPAVLVLLDDEVGDLGGEVVVQLALAHPDAVSFVAAVPMAGAEGEPRRRRLLRVAMETVTDVVARREALSRGFAIDDTLRVFLVFSAAARAAPGALSTALQTVHQVAAECFDQTRLEVHALIFLPDLGDAASRELFYRDAYLRLLELDEIGAADRALGTRAHSSFDFRWFVDSRTRAGAHAGGLDDVRSPVARFLATLLDGRETGAAAAAGRAREQLRSTIRSRHAGYSTFGLAVYFHYPRLLLRALAADAAALHLAGYAGTRLGPTEEPAAAALPPLLESWSGRIRGELSSLLSPALRDRPQLDAAEASRQAQQRAGVMDVLRQWLEPAAREVLAAGGVPLARRVLEAFEEAQPSEDPAAEGTASVGVLRRDALRSARDLVRYDTLVAREAERGARWEAVRADSGAEPAAVEQTERELREAAALRRRADAVLDAASRPDDFERELLSLQAEVEELGLAPSREVAAPVESAAASPAEEGTAPASVPGTGSSRPRAARTAWGRVGAWLGGLIRPPAPAAKWPNFSRWRRRDRRPGGSPPTDSSPQPAQPNVPAASLPVHVWHLAEQLRAVDGLERLVGRLLAALRQHEADVAATAHAFERDRDRLRDWLTAGDRFHYPAIDLHDFEAYAARYVAPIEERLARAFDRRRLARSFSLEPRSLAAFESRLLARFPGFHDALDEAAGTVGAPLEEEDLRTILRRKPSHALRSTLTALADNAQPLGRPGPTGDTPPFTSTALYGHREVFELLQDDPGAGAALAGRAVEPVETHDTLNLVLCSSLHGFSAHDLRKMLLLRGRTYDQDGMLPADVSDLVPTDVGERGEGREAFEVGVLARALAVLRDGTNPDTGEAAWVFEEHYLPADLLRTIDLLLYSLAHRGVQARLSAAVDAILAEPSGIERLREAALSPTLSEAERRWLFDVLAEFETHSTFTWRYPVFGAENEA